MYSWGVVDVLIVKAEAVGDAQLTIRGFATDQSAYSILGQICGREASMHR